MTDLLQLTVYGIVLGSIFALFGGLAHLQTLAAWQ